MKIFVITPPEGPRNSDLTGQLATLHGHDVIAFEAIFPDGVPSDFDPLRAQAINNRDLTVGEIGCALSHRTVWDRIAAGDDEWACVLEDDADIVDPGGLGSILERLEGSAAAPNATVVTFYTRYALLRSEGEWSRTFAEPTHTVAYCISRQAARRLADVNRHVCFTADWPRGSGVEFRCADDGIIEHGDSAPSLIASAATSDPLDLPFGARNLSLDVLVNRIGLYLGIHYLRNRRYFDGPRQYYRLVLRHRIIHQLARVVGRPLDRRRPGVRVLRRLSRRHG